MLQEYGNAQVLVVRNLMMVNRDVLAHRTVQGGQPASHRLGAFLEEPL